MSYFKQTFMLTEDEKRKVAEMNGKILKWMMEGRSVKYMAQQLKLTPQQVEHNINEMLYDLKKQVGIKKFIKTLFVK